MLIKSLNLFIIPQSKHIMSQETTHSEKYITQKTGKETGFSTPPLYFESFDITPFQAIAPKETGQTVPTGYFKEVETAIFSKTIAATKERSVISLRTRMLRFIPLSSAAAVALFVTVSYFSTTNFDTISVAEAEIWLEESALLANDYAVAELLETADFTENSLDQVRIDTNEVETYLQDTDTYSLLNEIY